MGRPTRANLDCKMYKTRRVKDVIYIFILKRKVGRRKRTDRNRKPIGESITKGRESGELERERYYFYENEYVNFHIKYFVLVVNVGHIIPFVGTCK